MSPGDLLPEGQYSEHVEIAHASVADPNVALQGRRQRAQINVRTDMLEIEYHAGRINHAMYMCGRMYQKVLEDSRGARSGGPSAFNTVGIAPPFTSSDHAIVKRITSSIRMDGLLESTLPVLGKRGQRVLECVLLYGYGFTQTATAMAAFDEIAFRGNRKSGKFYAETFRYLLRDLAAHWSETGHPLSIS